MGRFYEIDAGALTARLQLERAEPLPDGQGGALEHFMAVQPVWARIEPLVAREEDYAAGQRARLTHRVMIRAGVEARPGMRLTKGARVLVIETVSDPDEGGRFLELGCREMER